MDDLQREEVRPLALDLIVPVFNEEETIELFVDRIACLSPEIESALGAPNTVRIIFVDDGSRDSTPDILLRLARNRSNVAFVRLSRNFGKDAALAAGLAHSRGDALVPMDVDLQDPPEILPEMIRAWRSGALVVNAKRRSRASDDWLKRTSANFFYRVFNWISDYPIQENVGDYRLLDREVVSIINQMPERIRFMKGLFSWVGFPQSSVEYDRPVRAAGTTKWRFWRLWNFALDGITGSTTLPLRIWTYIGILIAMGAIAYLIYVIFEAFFFGISTPGYASLMVVVLFFGAVNMISVGLLGEYIGRISIEVRGRPLFVVQEKHGFEDGVAVARDASQSSLPELRA